EEINIEAEENAGELHDKLMNIGSQLVLKTVALIEKGHPATLPQRADESIKTAYKLNKDNCKINWDAPIDAIYNHIRGLSPFPGAWCTLINGTDALDVKIYKAEKESANHSNAFGSILSTKNELKIAVRGGYITVKDIKLPGKRTMDIKSLLNGYKFME